LTVDIGVILSIYLLSVSIYSMANTISPSTQGVERAAAVPAEEAATTRTAGNTTKDLACQT